MMLIAAHPFRIQESLAPKVEAPKLVVPALPNTFETGKGKRQRGVRHRARILSFGVV